MEKYVYLCEDSPEGIFSAIYRAYEERHGHAGNEIRIAGENWNRELFCEYRPVKTDFDRAVKVARTIRRDISQRGLEFVQKAAVSAQAEKADAIYRFVIEGLVVGDKVLTHLTAPFMQTLCAIERNVNNEIYHFHEFLRFEELENDVLFGRIHPGNDILPYLADHFSDRFSGENWVIADTVHHTVLIHQRMQECIYASLEDVDLDVLQLRYSAEEENMQKLWKLFVDTIAIKERINTDLQRQLLPLHFRKYMKEFS